MSLPTTAGGAGAPEWVHLLPAGEIRTGDGRGPYRVPDAGALIAASRMAAGDRLPIDENHATDLAAPHGLPAPARGWIVELQARQDGIWGRVEWTEEGRRLLEDRAYRGISPAIVHERDGRVTAILRASLVNRPNLRGLTTLHSLSAHACPEIPMNPLLEKLLAALGLPAATTEDAAIAAVTALHAEQARASTALQAALDPIAAAAGLQSGADAAAVLLGVQQLAVNDGAQAVTALQAELASLTDRFNALSPRSEMAAAAIDAALFDRAIADADALIDGYLKVRYALPLTIVPRLVKDLSLRISIYYAHAHVAEQKIKDDYEAALKTLREISGGTIRLDVEGAEPPASGASEVITNDPERPLSAATMKGYI